MAKELTHLIFAEQLIDPVLESDFRVIPDVLEKDSSTYLFGSIAPLTVNYEFLTFFDRKYWSWRELLHGIFDADTALPVIKMINRYKEDAERGGKRNALAFLCGYVSHMALAAVLNPYIMAVSGQIYSPEPNEAKKSKLRRRLVEGWIDCHIANQAQISVFEYDGIKRISANRATNFAMLDFLGTAIAKAWKREVNVGVLIKQFYFAQMTLANAVCQPVTTKLMSKLNTATGGNLKLPLSYCYPFDPSSPPQELVDFNSFKHPVTGRVIQKDFLGLIEEAGNLAMEYMGAIDDYLSNRIELDDVKEIIRPHNFYVGLPNCSVNEARHFAIIPEEKLWGFGRAAQVSGAGDRRQKKAEGKKVKVAKSSGAKGKEKPSKTPQQEQDPKDQKATAPKSDAKEAEVKQEEKKSTPVTTSSSEAKSDAKEEKAAAQEKDKSQDQVRQQPQRADAGEGVSPRPVPEVEEDEDDQGPIIAMPPPAAPAAPATETEDVAAPIPAPPPKATDQQDASSGVAPPPPPPPGVLSEEEPDEVIIAPPPPRRAEEPSPSSEATHSSAEQEAVVTPPPPRLQDTPQQAPQSQEYVPPVDAPEPEAPPAPEPEAPPAPEPEASPAPEPEASPAPEPEAPPAPEPEASPAPEPEEQPIAKDEAVQAPQEGLAQPMPDPTNNDEEASQAHSLMPPLPASAEESDDNPLRPAVGDKK